MASKYLLIPEISKSTQNWVSRVTVTEELATLTCQNGSLLKRYVLTDSEGNNIIGSIFGSELELNKMKSLLKQFHVYDIAGAYVSEVKPTFRILGQHQWYLQRRTLIQEVSHVEPTLRYFLDGVIPLSHLPNYIDQRNNSVDVIGILIKAGEVRSADSDRGALPVQTFTIVTKEKQPVIISVWEHLTQEIGPALVEAAENYSVIVGKRLTVKRFKGVSLSTRNGSSFTINPPIEATADLKTWFEDVQESELAKWLTTPSLEITMENHEQGRFKIYTVAELTQADQYGDYWTNGYLDIAEENQKFFYVGCDSCSSSICTIEGTKYNCRECNRDVTAIPMPFVLMKIIDNTGELTTIAIKQPAETILQTTAANIAKLYRMGERYNTDSIKNEFAGKLFNILLRRTYGRRTDNPKKLIIITFLPDDNSSTSTELPISPLKRQLGDIKIDKDEPAKKKQLVINNFEEESSTSTNNPVS